LGLDPFDGFFNKFEIKGMDKIFIFKKKPSDR